MISGQFLLLLDLLLFMWKLSSGFNVHILIEQPYCDSQLCLFIICATTHVGQLPLWMNCATTHIGQLPLRMNCTTTHIGQLPLRMNCTTTHIGQLPLWMIVAT